MKRNKENKTKKKKLTHDLPNITIENPVIYIFPLQLQQKKKKMHPEKKNYVDLRPDQILERKNKGLEENKTVCVEDKSMHMCVEREGTKKT